MIAEQAIYGAVRNGHALRTSSGDRSLAAELANRLDLPDTAPPGAIWSPYASGFPFRDRFVLARTFSDASSTRAGMVLAHALIVPLEDVVGQVDLRPLLGRLIQSPDQAPAFLENFAVELGDGAPPPSADLEEAAVALVTRANGPVVRIDSEGFEGLVASLWGQLWPALRRSFSFRLSFGPGDLFEDPGPTLVCTPGSLIGRWHEHRVMGRIGGPKPAAAAMLDGSGSGADLRTFADRIGAEMRAFADLPLIENAYRMAIGHPETMERLLAAVRLVQRLSPDPRRGEAEKRALLERLVAGIARSRPSDVLAMRNLSIAGYLRAEEVWRALESWPGRNGFPPQEDAEILDVLRNALTGSGAREEWRRAVAVGVNHAARSAPQPFASGFWRWARADHGLCESLLSLVAPDRGLEAGLAQAAPLRLDWKAAEPLLRASADRRLYALHAAAASAALPPREAARLQCSCEPGNDTGPMRIVLRSAMPTEVLDCAADTGDRRIVDIAGEAVAKTPALLADRDLGTAVNRSIWNAALGIDAEVWRGPADPRGAFDAILLDELAGQPLPEHLLERLSDTPLADLSSFGQRPALWRRIGGKTRERLLAATARAWLDLVTDDGSDPSVEPDLEQCILADPELDRLLDRLAHGRITLGLRVICALKGLDASKVRHWIDVAVRDSRPLSAHDAELLGRHVAARNDRGVVDRLVALYKAGRVDLRPALRACVGLIGIWDRWLLDVSSVSNAEKWHSLIQLAAELYPSGPDHEGLWERAGGRDSDLSHAGSGAARWRDAMRLVRQGKPPDVARLIREMRSEFGGNDRLRLLSGDVAFRGW